MMQKIQLRSGEPLEEKVRQALCTTEKPLFRWRDGKLIHKASRVVRSTVVTIPPLEELPSNGSGGQNERKKGFERRTQGKS